MQRIYDSYHIAQKNQRYNTELSHDELLAIETRRRDLLKKSKLAKHTYFQLWGTVLPRVWTSWEWWTTVAVYLMARLLLTYKVVDDSTLLLIDSRYLSVIGGFISFLLVFYNNQTYARFTTQYDQSMRMEGRIFNACYMAKDTMPPAMAWQFIRYLNGAHFLGYIGLSTCYERTNTFAPINEKLRLFSSLEVKRLDEINVDSGGGCYREVLGWEMTILHLAKQQKYLDGFEYQAIVSETLQLRGAIGALYDFEDQPIPFIYVHLIHFMTFLYLLYFSYFVGTSVGIDNQYRMIVGIIAVLIFGTILLGMLQIGRLLSLPYGDDLSDLSVLHYINFTWTSCRRILKGNIFELNTFNEELDLENGRPSLGNAFLDIDNQMRNVVYQSSMVDDTTTTKLINDSNPTPKFKYIVSNKSLQKTLSVDTTVYDVVNNTENSEDITIFEPSQ